jgi:DNA mismatch repair protein MutS2
MDTKTLQDLEFDCLLNLISSYASSASGKAAIQALRPLSSLAAVKERFHYIREIKACLWDRSLPLPHVPDILSFLKKAQIGGQMLEPSEIFIIGQFLEVTQRVHRYWQEHQKEAPCTAQLIKKIDPLLELKRKITQSVNAQGEILDTASPTLKALRQKVQSLKTKIKTTLNQLLDNPSYRSFWQEKLISVRNHRYVVAIKSEYQPFFKGIVHDFSRSKATCFVEPLEILPLNNELQMAIAEAEEEERRILKALTSEITLKAESLLLNHKILTQLDVLIALAQYTTEFDCAFPKFEERIYFKAARHPLLYWKEKKEKPDKKVVPINLYLTPPTRILIISGPNAGGKTVALKTLGLFVLMAQSGIPVPAEEAIMPFYKAVLSDIGDEQNLSDEMSTFSAHLRRLKEMSERADHNTLILVDEIGKGTNPTQGAALAMAFLDTFKEKGSQIVVTTHYDGLKSYGLKEEVALNAAVSIDMKNLKPTYQLIYDTLGVSFALEIAGKLGIKRQILERAQVYLKKLGGAGAEIMHEVLKIKENLQKRKNFVLKLLQQLLHLNRKQKALLKEIENKREEIYLKERQRLEALMQDIEKAIRHLQRQGGDIHHLKEKKRLLKEVKRQLAVSLTKEELVLKPGMWVRLSSKFGRKTAQVKTVFPESVEVIIGNLRWQVPKSGIEEVIGKAPSLPQGVKVNTVSTPTSEINLLGKQVDEALMEVEKAIDTAVLCGLKQMRIIHGLGTGRLRAAIQEYLKSHPQVAEFKEALPHEGGQGVTVIRIKE